MTKSVMMEKDKSQVTERILDLNMEIIYLLTGEDYKVVKKMSGDPLEPNCCLHGTSPLHCLTTERKEKKILEVTKKMMELLTGEVPIRCQDVTVYFSMEEWEYLEGHKDLYKNVMMDHHRSLNSEKFEKNAFFLNEILFNLILEIIYLLTAEDFSVVMKKPLNITKRKSHRLSTRKRQRQNPITVPPPSFLTLERNSKKILEVTKKMTKLLTGEVPIRCQDVTVYFSMEEWEFLERHKDLYKDVMMENQPPLTWPGKMNLNCK
ncbi:hypothetical protein AB205_0097050 [Aquarana catesbeiana]|uniref:KRAB domain-containing protein n=1 Tax=Aquarana catesbeiana TaxID=8400 RepID=A0A2G9Q6H6_AQUCT|nr:hypothetical protein AB205_0097050 [Aquarana catesbeiana]